MSSDQTPEPDWSPSVELPMLRLRARLRAAVRDFFAQRGVLEVDTPVLASSGNPDPYIESFACTWHGPVDWLAHKLHLRTSPEFFHKRLLAAGVGPIYELGPVFRQGELGPRHNPEFSLLEWYRPGWSMAELMIETVELVQTCLALLGKDRQCSELSYQQAFLLADLPDPLLATDQDLAHAAADRGLPFEALARDDLLSLLLSHVVEPSLPATGLVLLRHFPASQAALARICPEDPRVAERFELYLDRSELANGYRELTDPDEQSARFEAQNKSRAERGQAEVRSDRKLIAALRSGMPDCSGVALGFDRLLACIADRKTLAEVLPFSAERC